MGEDNFPDSVTGPLLGLPDDDKHVGTVHVTDCFGYPQKLAEEEEEDAEGRAYQTDMLHSLREVNVDCNIVGWYQSSSLGSHVTEQLIETQLSYEQEIEQSFVLIFDPQLVDKGVAAFTALRLKPDFAAAYRAGKGVLPSDIFEEVPITISNPVLVDAFLLDRAVAPSLDMFDLECQSNLEKSVTYLLDSLDYLGSEQQKMQYFERLAVRQSIQKGFVDKQKPAEGAEKEAGILDTLLIAKQIQTVCKNIDEYAGDAVSKVALVGGLA